ncbi:MAG: 3-oxoadipate enol-lactonase [Solirubrobacteraceae bacterium]
MTVALHHTCDGNLEAPDLLLGGSLGTTLEMWEPQLAGLGAVARLIRFEHRGHGGSPVPPGPYSIADLGADVLALMDRLELERASYCGLSLGGMVGQWLAMNAPGRIDRLILICTSAHLPPPQDWRDRAAAVREAGSPEAIADAVLGRWFTPGYRERNPAIVAGYREMICSISGDGYAACCEAIADMDLRPGLEHIVAPTLVLAGAEDPSIPPQHGQAIAEAVPGARFEVLDPGAHLLSVERATEVSGLIAGHLNPPTGGP